MERCSFRLYKKSWQAYLSLKEWCRVNRVPMGRILNVTLQAMQGMPDYKISKQAIITIPYPKQTDIDDRLRYKRTKAILTRVKSNENDSKLQRSGAIEAQLGRGADSE